jgi:GT2 family glycosyltransferase
VIIPTKNRPTALENALVTVLEQTSVPTEVIIIDQSTTGETKSVVTRLAETVKQAGHTLPRFVYVCDPAINSAGAARNVAIELSTCSVLVFLDDDVLLEKSFLEEILSVYSQHSDVGMVSGIISNYPKRSFRERFFERVFCVGPFRDERLPIYWNADALRSSEPIPVRKVSGGVMSVRRSALGYERFNGEYRGRGEDVDVSWRISERFPVLLTPRARLTHLATRVGRVPEHWITSAVISQHYLYHRHWKSSFTSRLAFLWFNCGLIAVSAFSSIRQRSLVPSRALADGIKVARTYRGAGPPATHKDSAATS